MSPRWRIHGGCGATVPLEDARNIYVARTYAYVAGGKQGLVIVDVETAGASADRSGVQRRRANSTTRAT